MSLDFDALYSASIPSSSAGPATPKPSAVAAPASAPVSGLDFDSLFLSAIPQAAATAPGATVGVSGFVDQYLPLAQRVSTNTGVSPQALLGQWGLETGWGKSVIPGTNNLGNIKDLSGRGPVAIDNMNKTSSAYQAFDTPDAFGDHFTGLLGRRYKGALNAGEDTQKYFTALKNGGYAEDPNYIKSGMAASNQVAAYLRVKPQAVTSVHGRNAGSQDLPAGSTGFIDTSAGVPVKDKKGLLETAKDGFTGGLKSSQALGAQFGALLLSTGGVAPELQKKLMDYGDGKTKEQGDLVGDVASFTDAMAPGGDLPRWVASSAGYLAYQIGESILTGGAGAVVGKAVGKSAVSVLAKGLVEKEIMSLSSAEVASKYTSSQIAAIAAGKVAAKLGAASTVFANNIRQEGGSIYNDAEEEARKKGESTDVARVWLAALAAAGVDTVADLSMAKGVLGMREGSTAASYAGRLAREVPKNMLTQGGTEVAQTVIEQWGAKKVIGDAASVKDIIDSAAVGALGGSAGAMGVALHRRKAELAPVAAMAIEPNSPLSRAAMAAAGSTEALMQHARAVTQQPAAEPGAVAPAPGTDAQGMGAAADPLAARVSDAIAQARALGAAQALRADGAPINASRFVNDLAIAGSQSTSAALREQALSRLEYGLEWVQANPAPVASPVLEQVVGLPAERGNPSRLTTAAQRQQGADRDAQLQQQINAAGTVFDQNSARTQASVNQQQKFGFNPSDTRDSALQGKEVVLSNAEQLQLDVAAEKGRNSAADPSALEMSSASFAPTDPAALVLPVDFRAPRSTSLFTPDPAVAKDELARLAAQDRANARGTARIGQRAIADAAPPVAPAPPTPSQVMSALSVAPFQRTTAQQVLLNAARASYRVDQLGLMERAANQPHAMSAVDRLQLRTLEIKRSQGRRSLSAPGLDGVTISRARAAPGQGPAIFRQRKAELVPLIASGMTTIERRSDGFYLVDGARRKQARLQGPADAQLARKAVLDYINARAHAAGTSPTNDRTTSWAQIDANNAKKGDRFRVNGQTILIENPQGSERSSRPGAATAWKTTMAHHYGDIAGTLGADGDPVDVFVGPRADTDKIYVIDQSNRDGSFDEHKVMMGFTSESEARAGYLANYEKGWTGLSAINEMTPAEFAQWVKSDATQQPLGKNYGNFRQRDGRNDSARLQDGGAELPASVAAAPAGPGLRDDGKADANTGAPGRSGDGLGVADNASPTTGDVTIQVDGKKRTLDLVEPNAAGAAASERRPGGGRNISGQNAALMQQLAKLFGKDVKYFRDAKLGDGFVTPDQPSTIFLNESSTISPVAVFGHEFLHQLKNTMPEVHSALMQAVEARLKKGARADFRRDYSQDKSGNDGALNAGELEEVTSDIGGNLMSDPGFWKEVFDQVQQDNPTASKGYIARLADQLYKLLDKLLGSLKQGNFKSTELVNDLGALRTAFKLALAQYIQTQGISQAQMQGEILKAGQWAKEMTQPAANAKESKSRGMDYTVESDGTRTAVAKVGSKTVGRATAWEDSRGKWVIMQSEVLPMYRRRGIAAKMYTQIEESSGRQLEPAVSLSDDAFGLWKSFRPESVAQDLRHRPELIGRKVSKDGRVGTITEASGGVASIQYADAAVGTPNSKTIIRRDALESSLLPEDGTQGDITKSPVRNDLADNPKDDNQPMGKPGGVAAGAGSRDGQAPAYGQAIPGSTSALGVHFSPNARTSLDARRYGQGYAGLEAERLSGRENDDIRPRAFYYVDTGEGAQPEAGVGGIAHQTRLNNLYDVRKDVSGLVKANPGTNNWERAVMKAGYDGYLNNDPRRTQGFAVLLGKKHQQVPVQQIAKLGFSETSQADTAIKKGLMSKEMAAIKVGNIPGAKLANGALTVPESSREAANDEMARIDSPVRFSPMRGQTDTPEFKKWFGDSKVVDSKGKPLVVYHGTQNPWTVQLSKEARLAQFDVKTRGIPKSIVDAERPYMARGAGAVWTTDSEYVADEYADGGEVMSIYVSLQNPLDLRPGVTGIQKVNDILSQAGLPEAGDAYGYDKGVAQSIVWDNTRLIAYARNNGYDGLIYPDTDTRGRSVHTSYVALQTGQIKSAIGNNGSFDSTQGDITKSPARSAPNSEYAAVDKKYRDSATWLKTPGGDATDLTERQWVHVRTPAFKSWFGDWEKAYAEGGVWGSNEDTSKAVGINGEPLVVYHGTDQGGFSEFHKPAGTKRGDLGIFTSSNWRTALSYVAKGRYAERIALPVSQKDLESMGAEFREEDGEYFYTDKFGEEGGPFKSQKEAVTQALVSDDFDPTPGVYALFMNIRNAHEDYFEGASWSGERYEQFQVRDADDELIYAEDGSTYMSQADAQKLADNIGGTVEPAANHDTTTDDVVLEARRYAQRDGAIIRQVMDDGFGLASDELSDVFVAFSPDQLKSADFNDGSYSLSSRDIRLSKERDQTGVSDVSSPIARTAGDAAKESAAYPLAGKVVDGRSVRDDVPNMSSIAASLDAYTVLPGVREVPMSAFPGLTGKSYSASETKRIERLADRIQDSRELNPLIVVIDDEGPYILEGTHRGEALYKLGAKAFPAVVVTDDTAESATPELVGAPADPAMAGRALGELRRRLSVLQSVRLCLT